MAAFNEGQIRTIDNFDYLFPVVIVWLERVFRMFPPFSDPGCSRRDARVAEFGRTGFVSQPTCGLPVVDR